jgi:hypothetical protein
VKIPTPTVVMMKRVLERQRRPIGGLGRGILGAGGSSGVCCDALDNGSWLPDGFVHCCCDLGMKEKCPDDGLDSYSFSSSPTLPVWLTGLTFEPTLDYIAENLLSSG